MNFEKFLALIQQPAVYLPVIGVTMLALFLAKKPATAVYVGLMPLINWSFAAVPTFPIPENFGGGQFQPLAIVTGLVLVVRDFAQREIGHRILAAMIIGLVFSTMTSWIVVVFASGAAFLISETVDWAVYTFTKRPLSQRIMISSTLSAPLDSVAFIWLASFVVPGIFAWGTVIAGIVSKLLGAAVVAWFVARGEEVSQTAASESVHRPVVPRPSSKAASQSRLPKPVPYMTPPKKVVQAAEAGHGAPTRSSPTEETAPAVAADVFVSYQRNDRARVLQMVEMLKSSGLNVWLDTSLKAGSAFDAEITRQVRSAKCVLVCWSNNAVASDWVRAEATEGRGRGVLVSCLLEPCEPYPPFNIVHHEDLVGWSGDRADTRWQRLSALVAETARRQA